MKLKQDLDIMSGRVPNTEKYNQVLSAGTYIDRYGSFMGKYVSPFGVPYTQRSLPYVENPKAYHVYLVKKDIVGVTSSKIMILFIHMTIVHIREILSIKKWDKGGVITILGKSKHGNGYWNRFLWIRKLIFYMSIIAVLELFA